MVVSPCSRCKQKQERDAKPRSPGSPLCRGAEGVQASSRAEPSVKFPTGISRGGGGSSRDPHCAPPAARRCSQLCLDLLGPLSPRRGVWARFTGPAQRSTAPASTVHAGKGLCSPSVPADTTVTKLAGRIGQNLPKVPPNHSDILSCLLGLTVAAVVPAFLTSL